jgi:eukaryotic-like serine/threonine-protein kinase
MDVPAHIGRFRVTGLVGEGAMGVVFRARDESLDRDVALKVMRTRSADAEDEERFLREARAVARLQHPNIVTLYELGDHQGSPFIAMELLEGVDLQRAIEGGLRPNPRATLPIVLHLLAGLGHAHDNGIVHRDVKPSNLFLPRGRPAKIMDFGVARLGGSTTATGLIMGTPNYMSPEQVQARPMDGRSDLFSAGLILYELVTGEKAYQGDSVVALMYKIAHEDPDLALIPRGAKWDRLRAVISRALFKEPDRRYPTAAAMSADLALALQDLGGPIEGEAASDRGLVKRAAQPPAAARSATLGAEPGAEMPETAGMHMPAPAAGPASRAAAAPLTTSARRPAWLIPAIAGVIVLAVTAAALLALLAWPRAPGAAVRSPPPEPTAAAEPLVSAAGRVDAARAAGQTPRPFVTGAPSATVAAPAPRRRAGATLASTPPSSPSPREAAGAARPGAGDDTADASVPGPRAAGASLDRANDLYERGRYAAALAEAKGVLRREPGNAEARSLLDDIEVDIAVESRLKQAREALRRGDHEAALEQVRAGLAVKSTDSRLLALFRELTE